MSSPFAEILGESAVIVGLRRQLEQIVHRYAGARRLPPLLLLGETGTGKSMIARALHQAGPRARQPFVDVNCAAIPATLMESEMFGFERGAFTDARRAKPGLFAAADRGTIFLDEIGLLPEGLQAKLLKVVEERQLRPLGATVTRAIDVWIIAATSEDLEVATRKQRFREDLYHRLAVVTLRIPPLRERGHDIALLAEHFLTRACSEYGLEKRLTPAALARLTKHDWPGNIRELGNVVERVALLSDSASISAEALGLGSADGVRIESAEPRDGRDIEPRAPIDDAVAAVERDHLRQALGAAGGNVTRAAQRLGLTRNTLRYRLRKHGLASSDSEPIAPPSAGAAPPFAPARWERRRLGFLLIMLAPASDHNEQAQRALLDEILQKLVAFGGTLDGVSPVGATAVFGLDSVEDASRRAAHAASAIRNLAARTRDVDAAAPGVKLAIHSAPVLLCRLGNGVHVDMEARADAWRTLESLVARASDGAIIVGAPASASLRAAFQLTPADTDDGACLLVGGERAAAWREGATFVGRRDEMTMLQGRLELTRSGRGQVVQISGEPGIGKSRLLFEFHRMLDAETVSYVSARSVSYGRDIPLLPIIEMIRRGHGIEDADSVDVVRRKLLSRLTALGLPADQTMPYLLRLLDISDGTESLQHLTGDAIHQKTLETFQRVAVASSRVRPLVVAIEDLHWMDRASESYVSVLVDALVEAPILLITTHRSGYRPPWSDRSYVSELRLQPLGRADAHRVLIAAVGTDRPLSTATTAAILDRADGNPFFIEELARAIGADTGAAPAQVPESVEAVLLARIDRLSDECKAVLQAAAVLGRDVPVRVLEAILPGVATLNERLSELQRLEYLHDRSDGARQLYRFKHALTQEVGYSSLLIDDRRALHARIIEAIETQHADRLTEHTEKLAHHAVRGEVWEKAVHYLRQSGLRALARSAHHEAAACLDEALQIVDKLPEGRTLMAIDLRLDAFQPFLILAEYRRGLDATAEAARLAERVGDHRRLAHALANQCLMFRVMGMTDAAIEPGRRALTLAAEVGDTDLVASTNYFLATAHTSRGEWAEAETYYRAAMAAMPPLDGEATPERVRTLPFFAAGVRAWLSWALESRGEFAEALALAQAALRISQVRGSKATEGAHGCFLGMVWLGIGDAVEAIRVLEPALEVCRTYDVRDFVGIVSMVLGRAYALAGRTANAIASLEAGAAHCETINQMTNFPARLSNLAEAYALAGRRDDAEQTARRALALATEQGRRADQALCLRVLGRLAIDADPPDAGAAGKYFAQSCELGAALGMRPLVAHCHLDLARLYRSAGRPTEADEHFTLATSMYRTMDMRIWLEKAEAEFAADR
jgi:DNA-binding NtrC family response regulator/tetratricopeptide (TPR) repeat protein